jgi:hypothetical protein
MNISKPILIAIIALILISPLSYGDWVDGTPWAMDIYNRLKPLSVHAAPRPLLAPRLGERREFFALDLQRGRQYITSATLRGIGENCYIFVEDRQWNRTVTLLTVELLKKAFDRQIYDTLTKAFGTPPDIDGDPRIYILLLDIPDVNLPGGEYISGYFSPVNEERGTLFDPRYGVFLTSNEVEMIYLDCNPQNPYSQTARSTLAHEFQHLIHWKKDRDEEVWVNEGCSMLASFLCGYGDQMKRHVEAFERNPSASLVNWPRKGESLLASYGAVYLWMLYIYEHYGGIPAIRAIVRNKMNGIEGIESALSALGVRRSFEEVFSDWKVANLIDDEMLEGGRYGYAHLDIRVRPSRTVSSYPVEAIRGKLDAAYASDYVQLEPMGEGRLTILFDGERRYNPDVRLIGMRNDRAGFVSRIEVNRDTGVGRGVVDRFGSVYGPVILAISFASKGTEINAEYEISARFGSDVRFSVSLIRNPIHSRYWEVIAIPSENPGADVPYLRLLLNGKRAGYDLRMNPIAKGKIFATSVFIPFGIKAEELTWQAFFLGEKIGEGGFH